MTRRRVVTALAAVVVVVILCAAFQIVHRLQHAPLSVATTHAHGGSLDTLLEGELSGSATAHEACFWIAIPGSAAKAYLVWPRGWSADPDPLTIVDDWGGSHAQVGDHVKLSGGGGGPPPFTPRGCPDPGTGDYLFGVSEVVDPQD